ncbi:MAG: LysR family transcriptional regulator [Gammaproteobacteria bacterium]|nr:MAG: LysR family transcriptional regulator [Gammaproteobacteria bacterium]
MPQADAHLNQLRQLRAFCHAAQTGSISKAATRLGLSQPSVSLQIQALEKELDTLLFERAGPRIRLTPAGELLQDMAQPLVDGLARLADSFAARLGEVHAGPLDIAAGEATLLYILPDVIKAFADEYPQIDIRMHNVTGHDGLELLRANDVDFAVGSMIDVPDDLVYHPIYNYEPSLITPRDHPLAKLEEVKLADLSPYGLILPPRHLSTWNLVDLVFEQHGVPYNVVLEAGGWEVIKRYVENGLGISIVTSICLEGHENLEVRPMDNYFPTRSYGMVIRRGKFLSPQAKAFLERMDPDFFLRQSVPPKRLKGRSPRRTGAMDR